MGDIKVRLKPDVKAKQQAAGLTPQELARMARDRDPALERVPAEDKSRAKALEEGLPQNLKRQLRSDLPGGISAVESGHVGALKKGPIEYGAASQGEALKVGSDGLVIEETPDRRRVKREFTPEDLMDPKIAEAPGSPLASGMPVSDPTGKSAEIISADVAAVDTSDSLPSGDAKSLAEAAKGLSSEASTGVLTPSQGDEISSSAAGAEASQFVSESKVSQAERKALKAKVDGGLAEILASAEIRDPVGVESGAAEIEEAAERSSATAEAAKGSVWREGLSPSDQRRALEAVDKLLLSDGSPLSRVKELESRDLIIAASEAARKIQGSEERKANLADVLSQAAQAVRDGEGNFYSDKLLWELIQNKRVKGQPDVVARLEDIFKDKDAHPEDVNRDRVRPPQEPRDTADSTDYSMAA